MSTYPLVPLAEVATVRSGYAFKSSDWTESGVPVLKIANIHPGLVDLAGCGFVDEATAAKAQSFTVERDDSLIAMSGASVGKVGRVRFSERALVNQRVGRFSVLDPAKLDADFLYYSLQLPATVDYLTGSAYGSAQPNISPSLILNAEIPLPSLSEQKSITDLLCSLDDKIAANSRVVAHSDELSQAIFRSALTGNSQMLPLSNIADFVNGRAFTKNASGTGRVVIRIAEMNSGIGTSTVFNDIEVDEKHIARPGDILFAWSGSLTLQRWFRPEGIVNQHIFKVIARDRNPNWLVYELLREKLGYFKRVAANKATTMGHIQRKDLDELVPVPDDASQKHISEQMAALWNTMLNAEQESLQLADTRDALLPQLMSGKLRVCDAEAVVEDVL